MFVLQTTIAVLICFLAIVSYNNIASVLARRASRRRDSESSLGHDSKACGQASNNSPEKPGVKAIAEEIGPDAEELHTYKQLYHKIHNLENFPEILPQCHDVLIDLMAETLSDALKNPENTILSVDEFSKALLEQFLEQNHNNATDGWEAYLERRRAGAPREMFSDLDEARWWLKQAAPVKYVDGAWLGHINKITTPFNLRSITKNAWQVMSEELGDGDLAKNHVEVYRNLMTEIGANLPEADHKDFIHPRHGLRETRVWKAAIAQLLISLFPHDFLPEILGFNMAYEALPLHLMKTTKELNELRLNSYYFVLHISIDNSDSGHAAMAMMAVVDYINHISHESGKQAAESAWRRVQAGFILAEGLPTMPVSETQKKNDKSPFPKTEEEATIIDIFKAKVKVAHKIHCNSRLRIGKHTLIDWLDPNSFPNVKWQQEFLQDLSNCKPWVIKGDSRKSRLSRELSWEGKMFGSFTQAEVEAVNRWIDSLATKPQTSVKKSVYYDFVKMKPTVLGHDICVHYPVYDTAASGHACCLRNTPNEIANHISNQLSTTSNVHRLLPLWFVSTCLLECFVNVPVRVSDKAGSAIVKVLRAQYGYEPEGSGVAGIDELVRTNEGKAIGLVEIGLEMYRRLGLSVPRDLHEVFGLGCEHILKYCTAILECSMRPIEHAEFLVGMSAAYIELQELVQKQMSAVLAPEYSKALTNITQRERNAMNMFVASISNDPEKKVRFAQGCSNYQEQLSHIVGTNVNDKTM